MNICMDCKWFNTEYYDYEPPHPDAGRGCCDNPKLSSDDPDGLDWWECAEISVGPEFGCIHWEPKCK